MVAHLAEQVTQRLLHEHEPVLLLVADGSQGKLEVGEQLVELVLGE